jgi:hypothetical protein
MEHAKQILERTVASIGEIRGIPAPWAYVSDTTENWIEMKIIYFIDSYGAQFSVGDKVYTRGIDALKAAQVKLARQVIELSDKTPAHEVKL